MKKMSGISNLINANYVTILFNDKITVRKEALQYGYFDMIVEIGSSLGLWLGLSAFDVLAYKLRFYVWVKDLLKKMFKHKNDVGRMN